MCSSDPPRVWDILPGKELPPVRGHKNAVRAAAFSPDGGRVLIDGTDIAHVPPSQLRAQIGTVPQDVQLFAGTVRDPRG